MIEIAEFTAFLSASLILGQFVSVALTCGLSQSLLFSVISTDHEIWIDSLFTNYSHDQYLKKKEKLGHTNKWNQSKNDQKVLRES